MTIRTDICLIPRGHILILLKEIVKLILFLVQYLSFHFQVFNFLTFHLQVFIIRKFWKNNCEK